MVQSYKSGLMTLFESGISGSAVRLHQHPQRSAAGGREHPAGAARGLRAGRHRALREAGIQHQGTDMITRSVVNVGPDCAVEILSKPLTQWDG